MKKLLLIIFLLTGNTPFLLSMEEEIIDLTRKKVANTLPSEEFPPYKIQSSSFNLLVAKCKNKLSDSNDQYIKPNDLEDSLIQDPNILYLYLKQNKQFHGRPTPIKKDKAIFAKLKQKEPEKYKAFCAAIVNNALAKERYESEGLSGRSSDKKSNSSGDSGSLLNFEQISHSHTQDFLTWWTVQMEKDRKESQQERRIDKIKYYLAVGFAVLQTVGSLVPMILSYANPTCPSAQPTNTTVNF